MGHGEAFAMRAIPLHLLGLILFVILVPYVHADFSGQVVSVLDGETIEVLHNTHAERIRLSALLVEGLQTVTALHQNILGTAVVVDHV